MTDGLATIVGPRGMRLSGGQLQRALAARALVRTPELLVVDDLSSALDVETERALWDGLADRPSADALLVVSHRPRVLERAAPLLVLDEADRVHRARSAEPGASLPGMANTLHWQDEQAEIHKVVVGPMDNNVYVLRCKQTGDAVLLDAANEHDRLLDLSKALNVREVLETHGHWDHIQAVPADARRRLLGARDRRGRGDAAVLRPVARGRVGHRGRPPAPAHDPHARPHAGFDVLPRRGLADPVQRRHAVPRRARQHQLPGRRLPDDHPLDRGPASSRSCPPTRSCCPATATRRRSARSRRTSRSGSTGAGR